MKGHRNYSGRSRLYFCIISLRRAANTAPQTRSTLRYPPLRTEYPKARDKVVFPGAGDSEGKRNSGGRKHCRHGNRSVFREAVNREAGARRSPVSPRFHRQRGIHRAFRRISHGGRKCTQPSANALRVLNCGELPGGADKHRQEPYSAGQHQPSGRKYPPEEPDVLIACDEPHSAGSPQADRRQHSPTNARSRAPPA